MSFPKNIQAILAVAMAAFFLPASGRADTIQLRTPQTPLTIVTGTTTSFNLDEIFTLVRFTCDFGTGTGTLTGTQTIDVQLFPLDTPATTKNFLTYADNGLYTNTFIHRSVTNFIVQGGGFLQGTTTASWLRTNTAGTAYDNLGSVVQDWPVINEPGISSTSGTIAMAKLGNDPNSATNQWFFNLADNSANLDHQNGGFTVFGQVLGDGMTVVNKIAGIPALNASSLFAPESPLRALSELPILDYVDNANPGRLVTFPSISRLSVSSYAVATLGQPAGSTNVVATVEAKTLNLKSVGTGTSTSGTVKISATAGANSYQMDIPFTVVAAAPTPVLPLRFFRSQSVKIHPGNSTTVDISKFFSIVRFNSFKWGSFDLQLYMEPTPNAAQNFLTYVNANAYTNTIFDTFTLDTSTTPPTSTLAWGGRLKTQTSTWLGGTLALTGTSSSATDDTGNNPLNTRGTIVLRKTVNEAKTAYIPNSATNQWTFNLSHNVNNGDVWGLATFGEVLGNGMTEVVDKMAAVRMGTIWINTPTLDNTTTYWNFSYNSTVPPYTAPKPVSTPWYSWFDNLPVDGYQNQSSFGTLVGFSSIVPVRMASYTAVTPDDNSFILTASGTQVTLAASSTATVGGTIQIDGAFGGKTYRLNVPVNVLSMVAKDATATQTNTSSYNLSVTGQYTGGEQNLTYTWDAGGSSAVTITPNGTNAAKNAMATFTKAGSYTLRVTVKNPAGGISTSSVNITINQTATSIEISPKTAVLEFGGTQTFTAVAKDQYGDPMTSQPSPWQWSCNGYGSMNETSGAYTAGNTPETASVVVTSPDTGDLMATAKVIIAHLTTETLHLARGWNLISLPVEPVEQDAAELFGSKVLSNSIWCWDAANKRFRQPTVLHAFEACWVYAPASDDVSVTGAAAPPASSVITLKKGWNLVGSLGHPHLTAKLWGWQAGSNGHFFMESQPKTGNGYWMLIPEDGSWDLSTSP